MSTIEYTQLSRTEHNISRNSQFFTVISTIKMAYATSKTIPFVSVLQATGHGEVWDHTDAKKFTQFGWRCTNRESSYSPTQTLIGNWNEQRFDISTLSQAKTIPSQYDHYFETTHKKSYCRQNYKKVPKALKHLEARECTSFPGHQPELDPIHLKKEYNSFMTTSRAAFGDPNKMK